MWPNWKNACWKSTWAAWKSKVDEEEEDEGANHGKKLKGKRRAEDYEKNTLGTEMYGEWKYDNNRNTKWRFN